MMAMFFNRIHVGCALAAPRSFACGELRGERATYERAAGGAGKNSSDD
jgi:hypothetical protein